MFLFLIFIPLLASEQNCNNEKILNVPRLTSIAMIACCKNNNHIQNNFQSLLSAYYGYFDIPEFESKLDNEIVKEDDRLQKIKRSIENIKDRRTFLKQFLHDGSLIILEIFGKETGTYIFLHDQLIIKISNVYKSKITENNHIMYGYFDDKNIYKLDCSTQTYEKFPNDKYVQSLCYDRGHLYIGTDSKLYCADPANSSKITNSWIIKEHAYITYCKQLTDEYLFVKTKFKGSYSINLKNNQISCVFSKKDCAWIDFSPSLAKAAVRNEASSNLSIYEITEGVFSNKQVLPLSLISTFIFLPFHENILAISHQATIQDDISEGYSLHDLNNKSIIVRVCTDSYVSMLYPTNQFLLAYCPIDKKLYKTDLNLLLNSYALKKKCNQQESPYIIDKRQNKEDSTTNTYDNSYIDHESLLF